jgi:uncharacterized OB-fold protein
MSRSFAANRMIGFIDCGDRFWEHLEDGEFRLCRCAGCRRWLWETQLGGLDIRSGECGSWEQEWPEVPFEGVVYAWLRTNQAFEGAETFVDDIPYVTIETELLGAGGPRVLGRLIGSEEGLAVGAAVRGEIDPPSPKTLGYPAVRWRLVSDEGAHDGA